MIISIITAMDRNRLIGNKNQLPWHLPADFAHFKSVTMGKPIIMGRKTYDSIGKPLPGRKNIVLSRSNDTVIEGVSIKPNLQAAIDDVSGEEELMVIGGSAIYELALPIAHRLYITYVDGEFEGDAWFPEFDINEWEITATAEHVADERNAYSCKFVTYDRK